MPSILYGSQGYPDEFGPTGSVLEFREDLFRTGALIRNQFRQSFGLLLTLRRFGRRAAQWLGVLLLFGDDIDRPTLDRRAEGDFEKFALAGRDFHQDQIDDLLLDLPDNVVGRIFVEPLGEVPRDPCSAAAEFVDESTEQVAIAVLDCANEKDESLVGKATLAGGGCHRRPLGQGALKGSEDFGLDVGAPLTWLALLCRRGERRDTS